jgi:hypothetical protein
MHYYQIMQREQKGGLRSSWTASIFESIDEAADAIKNEGMAGRRYVVVPIEGHAEFTVEETVSRTMHKLPPVLLGRAIGG